MVWATRFSLLLGGVALILRCGGGQGAHAQHSAVRSATALATGKVAITLANEGVAAGVASVDLHITGVEVRTRFGPWLQVPMEEGPKTIAVSASAPGALIAEGPLAEGVYEEVKLHLGGPHGVTRTDGAQSPLTGPPELRSEPVTLTIQRGCQLNQAFLVSAAQAVREEPPGSGCYTLDAHALLTRPLSASGSIAGRVVQVPSGKPLAGATVTAQAPLAGGTRYRVMRTAVTRQDGSYALDLLPQGTPYRVLVQPRQGHLTQRSALSDELRFPADGTNRLTHDCQVQFDEMKPVGRLVVSSFPGLDPPSHLSEINVRQAWPIGPSLGSLDLVIAQRRVTCPGPYEFDALPVGRYFVSYRCENALSGLQREGPSQEDRMLRRVEIHEGRTAFVH